MILDMLEDVMQKLKTRKQQDGTDAETARHLAVAYTLLEYALAYIKTYVPEESE